MSVVELANWAQAPMIQSAKTALAIQDLYAESSVQLMPLGTRIDLTDGRSFVYGKAGGTALAKAKINQSAVPSADWDNQAVTTAGAVGEQQITITCGGAVTANQFAGGFLVVNDANGEGEMYTIKSNTAGTTGVVVTFFEKIRTAITTSGEVTLCAHPLNGLIVCPTTITGAVQGVALIAVTANYYAWFQVKGPAAVLVAATLSAVTSVECATTAGGLIPTAETTFGPTLGMPIALAAATEYAIINLSIPGY